MVFPFIKRGGLSIDGFKLEADAEPLFVSTPEEKTSTTIRYESPEEFTTMILYRKVDAKPWEPEDLMFGATTPAEAAVRAHKGTRNTPKLKAGQVVYYGILTESGLDPNAPGFSWDRFQAKLSIEVLLLQPPQVDWVDPQPDTGAVVGGTFYRRHMKTTIETRFRMEVGREAPIEGPTGFYKMKDPVNTRFFSLSKDHTAEAVPLVPGTPYFALIRLSDDKGVWQIIKPDFATLKRKVTIQWKKFIVADDGDFDLLGVKDKGDDAELAFSVYQFKNREWQKVQTFYWGKQDITDKGADKEVFLNLPDAVLGPDPFDGVDPGAALGIEAKEHDYIWALFGEIDTTDTAGYQGPFGRTQLPIDFPVGSGKETVNPATTDTNLSLAATPKDGDGTLHLTAYVRHVVEYV